MLTVWCMALLTSWTPPRGWCECGSASGAIAAQASGCWRKRAGASPGHAPPARAPLSGWTAPEKSIGHKMLHRHTTPKHPAATQRSAKAAKQSPQTLSISSLMEHRGLPPVSLWGTSTESLVWRSVSSWGCSSRSVWSPIHLWWFD